MEDDIIGQDKGNKHRITAKNKRQQISNTTDSIQDNEFVRSIETTANKISTKKRIDTQLTPCSHPPPPTGPHSSRSVRVHPSLYLYPRLKKKALLKLAPPPPPPPPPPNFLLLTLYEAPSSPPAEGKEPSCKRGNGQATHHRPLSLT